MLTVDDTHFTPIRVRLPRSLDVNAPTIRLRINGLTVGRSSGIAELWTTYKADPNRSNADVAAGGNYIGAIDGGPGYTLKQLGYNPADGSITLWLNATYLRGEHGTLEEVRFWDGKPDQRYKLSVEGLSDRLASRPPSDEVKYMVVEPNSFYPQLNANEAIRNAFASLAVYGSNDAKDYALKRLDKSEITDLISDLSPGYQQYILDVLFHDRPITDNDPPVQIG